MRNIFTNQILPEFLLFLSFKLKFIMTQPEILSKLRIVFTEVEDTIQNVPELNFFQRPPTNKWSVAENVDHLFLVAKPLVSLFAKPELMTANWGKPTHAKRNYDELVAVYLEKIGNVGGTTSNFSPKNEIKTKPELTHNLISIQNKFLERVASLTENDLDTHQIPHPLIGLLTCREFLYFTHYHTCRHLKTIRKIIHDPFEK